MTGRVVVFQNREETAVDRTRQDSQTCGVREVGAIRQLSPQTVAWPTERPYAQALVRSVWDRLAELSELVTTQGPMARCGGC